MATNRTERWILAGGLFLPLVFAAGIALNASNIQRLRTQSAWVAHTHEVSAALEKVLSHLKDAETGQRGYLLTGDDRYLEPYRTASESIPRDMSRVEMLVGDNRAQVEALQRLRSHAHAKVTELEDTIGLRRDRGLAPALDVVASGRGKVEMDAARDVAAEMAAREGNLLVDREREATIAYRVALGSALAGGLAACALVVAYLLLLRRHLRDRERTTREIDEQRNFLQTTLASIGDGVITTDADGRVLFMNAVAEALTGWSSTGARGQDLATVFRIVNHETRAPVENPALRALSEGVVVGLANHTILIAADGAERAIDDSAAPIRIGGEVAGCVLVFRDITERSRMEAELAAADRRKDEFLATLAHELRNPLAPISNALYVLEQPNVAPEMAQRAKHTMRRQLAQTVRLVDDLMDAGRIRTGKLVLARERVRLAEVIEQAVESVMPAIEAARHELTVVLPSQAVELDADRARLAQVFSNLVGNAAKFTPASGHIEISAQLADGWVSVSVKDDGVGIAPGELEEIFGLFSQAARSVDRGGLGIGLSLVRQLAAMHGGTASAHSDGPGRGAVFVVRLPLPGA